jgi:hypothetical protein
VEQEVRKRGDDGSEDGAVDEKASPETNGSIQLDRPKKNAKRAPISAPPPTPSSAARA